MLLPRDVRFSDTHSCFVLNRVLGKGSFATVKLAVRKADGTKWAVKVIEKTALSQEDEDALKNEVQILEVRRGITWKYSILHAEEASVFLHTGLCSAVKKVLRYRVD